MWQILRKTNSAAVSSNLAKGAIPPAFSIDQTPKIPANSEEQQAKELMDQVGKFVIAVGQVQCYTLVQCPNNNLFCGPS